MENRSVLIGKFVLAAALLLPGSESYYLTPFKVHLVNNDSVSPVTTRIYGGQVAQQGQFPFMIYALIKVNTDLTQCSSALVSPKWVLLAAHCLHHAGLRAEDVILVGGRSYLYPYIRKRLETKFEEDVPEYMNVQERRVKSFYIHPKYNPQELDHDLALIKTHKEFIGTDIKPINLNFDKIEERKTCTILGWGLNAGNIQNFQLNYVESKEISTTFLGCRHKTCGPFICLKKDGAGICQGDSGSPLVCNGSVWGVASHLISDKVNPDCGDSLEEYYAELHPDEKWIKSVLSAGTKSTLTNTNTIFASFLIVTWLTSKTNV